jgi:hypothetical protein
MHACRGATVSMGLYVNGFRFSYFTKCEGASDFCKVAILSGLVQSVHYGNPFWKGNEEYGIYANEVRYCAETVPYTMLLKMERYA